MNLLATSSGRRFLFFALYVSEGAPIGFVWWALPTYLRHAGVPTPQIAAISALLVLPWALKFVWAPLVDVLHGGRWSLKAWIISAQILMGAALLPLTWLPLPRQFGVAISLLLVHAIAAATQDVAVDALAISTATPQERGRLNGWMQAGMLTGRALMGGGALLLAEWIGEAATILLFVAIIWSSLLLVLRVEMPKHNEMQGDGPRLPAFLATFGRVLRQRITWLCLAFALLGGAAFESVGGLAGPYLIDTGLSKSRVGTLMLLPIILALLAGALIGGWVADTFGKRRTVVLGQTIIIAGTLHLAVHVMAGNAPIPADEIWWLAMPVRPLLVVYLGIGVFTASTYALFMDLTHRGLEATQFSALMGATNGCEAWAIFVGGQLMTLEPRFLPPPMFGYPLAFSFLCAVSTLSLIMLIWMHPGDD